MKKEITFKASKKEQQLICFIREEYRFGRLEVVIHAGQPVRVIKASPEEIPLDGKFK